MALNPSIQFFLATSTLLSQLVLVLFLLLWIASKFNLQASNAYQKIRNHLSKKALLYSFIIALAATGGSLYLSEIAGLTPCKLCWFQRIFMYLAFILFGIALWYKSRDVFKYAVGLCSIGALFALYHYSLQVTTLFESASSTCSATGPACGVVSFMSFGYISIPLMAFTGFVLIIVLAFQKNETHLDKNKF